MKIKAVCEATGLTDRAVRYYIEEGLIEPDYTENYLGRKNYDFSGEDVHALENIVVLRKYGFSVSEIRTITENPERIEATCRELIERKRRSIADDSSALASLEGMLKNCPGTVDELAAALAAPAAPVPAEDSSHRQKGGASRVYPTIAFILPLLLGAFLLIMALLSFRYIVFNKASLIIFCISLVPPVLGLVLPRELKNNKARSITKKSLAVACLLLLPVIFISGLFLSFRSETDLANNYLHMDESSRANDRAFFFELFPSKFDFLWSTGKSQKYHYCDYEDLFGHKSDIFAEIKLDAKKFEKEIGLKKDNFDYYYRQHASDWIDYGGEYGPSGAIALKYEEFTRGNFNCIAFYTRAEPFEDYHESRTIFLFAYDPTDLTVRYAFYESDDYSDELPYFTSVSW